MMILVRKTTILICLLAALSLQAAGQCGNTQDSSSEPRLEYFSTYSYPKLALTLMLQGDVQAKIYIQADGSIAKIEKVSGDNLLFQYSSESLHKWRFKTAEYSSQLIVTVRFRILSGEGEEYPATRISGNLPTLLEITSPIHRQGVQSVGVL